jgi:hypothetical protein
MPFGSSFSRNSIANLHDDDGYLSLMSNIDSPQVLPESERRESGLYSAPGSKGTSPAGLQNTGPLSGSDDITEQIPPTGVSESTNNTSSDQALDRVGIWLLSIQHFSR